MSNNYFNTSASYTIQNSDANYYVAPNTGYTITIQGQSGGSANQYYYPYTQPIYTGTGWGSGTNTPNYPGYTQKPYPYNYNNYYYEDLELVSSLSLFMSEIFNGEEKINYKKLDYLFVQNIKEKINSGAIMQNTIYNMRMTISSHFPFLFEYFENFEQNKMKGYLAIL